MTRISPRDLNLALRTIGIAALLLAAFFLYRLSQQQPHPECQSPCRWNVVVGDGECWCPRGTK